MISWILYSFEQCSVLIVIIHSSMHIINRHLMEYKNEWCSTPGDLIESDWPNLLPPLVRIWIEYLNSNSWHSWPGSGHDGHQTCQISLAPDMPLWLKAKITETGSLCIAGGRWNLPAQVFYSCFNIYDIMCWLTIVVQSISLYSNDQGATIVGLFLYGWTL